MNIPPGVLHETFSTVFACERSFTSMDPLMRLKKKKGERLRDSLKFRLSGFVTLPEDLTFEQRIFLNKNIQTAYPECGSFRADSWLRLKKRFCHKTYKGR